MLLDDASLYISMFSNVCSRCQHFDEMSPFGERKVCRAFSQGIPAEIWTGQNKHTSPFPGDNGIMFEAHKDVKRDAYQEGNKEAFQKLR